MGFFNDILRLQEQAAAMTPYRKAQDLMVRGRPGSATITAVRETGMAPGGDPTVELDLSVTLEGESPYAVTHQQTISRIAVPSFQPGATVPVRVDPADTHTLMIS